MGRYFNKRLIRSLVRAHLFLGLIFLFVIVIKVILPMENIRVLIGIDFYKSLFSSPLLWGLYFVVLAVFTGKVFYSRQENKS